METITNEVIELIEKYPSKKEDKKGSLLFRFAYMGDTEKALQELASLAEHEQWTTTGGRENDILLSYLTYTFEKTVKDNLVILSDDKDRAVFNTGLLTENGEDILCMFNKFESSQKFPMHFQKFCKESDNDFMRHFSVTPTYVTYFDNPQDIYFDPSLEIVKNLDHILEDNFSRFPENLQNKGKHYILSLLSSGLDLTIKRCKRNYRIAVPQYYNEEITYLLPVDLDGTKMALAVGAINGRYRANTIFTLAMAYKNARLLMKPEADWLSLGL